MILAGRQSSRIRGGIYVEVLSERDKHTYALFGVVEICKSNLDRTAIVGTILMDLSQA